MTTIRKDTKARAIQALQSVPESPTDWAEASSPSIPAGSVLNVIVTTTPSTNRLSLWNFLFSVRVDTNTDAYLYPQGASLSSAQRNMQIEQWIDFATSSDSSNIRVHVIRIRNNDASAHIYHILYKAYTLAATSGSTGY